METDHDSTASMKWGGASEGAGLHELGAGLL